MSQTLKKILVGGLGGLTPIIVTLIISDADTISGYLRKLDGGVYEILGYIVQGLALFAIGGIWASLHRSEKDLRKVFQLGIVAPAVLVGMVSASGLNAARTKKIEPDVIAVVIRMMTKAEATPNLPIKEFLATFLQENLHTAKGGNGSAERFVKGLLRRP